MEDTIKLNIEVNDEELKKLEKYLKEITKETEKISNFGIEEMIAIAHKDKIFKAIERIVIYLLGILSGMVLEILISML